MLYLMYAFMSDDDFAMKYGVLEVKQDLAV